MENQIYQETSGIKLNQLAIDYLKESAKWSMFLAIMGFIGIGFMVLAALAMGVFFSARMSFPFGGFLSGIYILMAVLYFFPIYYLYKYATDIKTSLSENDEEGLATALGYLKSHHKFLGISIIVIISLYIFLIIGFIAFGVTNLMHV